MKLTVTAAIALLFTASIASANPAQVEYCSRISQALGAVGQEINDLKAKAASAGSDEELDAISENLADKVAQQETLSAQYTVNQCNAF